jgi:hypothetical protein
LDTVIVLNLCSIYCIGSHPRSHGQLVTAFRTVVFTYKYPLLDKAVLEFWFSLPIEYTYRNKPFRFLYREAMKGILTEKVRTAQ